MAEDRPKRGRPRKFGKRTSFNFRITAETQAQVRESAARSGRSLSEEIEYRLTRDFLQDIDRIRAEAVQLKAEAAELRAKAAARLSADEIQALRLAGFMILRELDAKARRVIIDYDALLAEGDGLLRGLRSGFVADEAPAPAPPPTLTDEEVMRAYQETKGTIDLLRRKADAALAGPSKPDAEAAR
jgi:hypothetical protein